MLLAGRPAESPKSRQKRVSSLQSRCAGGGDGPPAAAAEGVADLASALLERIPAELQRKPTAPLLFAIDHCFGIRGQGTVLTGTVLQVGIGTFACANPDRALP